MKWELHYKLDKEEAKKWNVPESSDELGYVFATRNEAELFGIELRKDPERYGCCGWLMDATIWAEAIPTEDNYRF